MDVDLACKVPRFKPVFECPCISRLSRPTTIPTITDGLDPGVLVCMPPGRAYGRAHEDQARTTTDPFSPANARPPPRRPACPARALLVKNTLRQRHGRRPAAGWGPSGVPGRRPPDRAEDSGLLYAP